MDERTITVLARKRRSNWVVLKLEYYKLNGVMLSADAGTSCVPRTIDKFGVSGDRSLATGLIVDSYRSASCILSETAYPGSLWMNEGAVSM